MSMSDPNVYAPRCAAAMRILPVPAKGSNTRCPFLTCTIKQTQSQEEQGPLEIL